MRRTHRFAAAAVGTLLSGLLIHGCADVGILGSKPDQAEVLALVDSYTFPPPGTDPIPSLVALPQGNAVQPAEKPELKIYRAVPKTPPGPQGKMILALVTSDKEYKYLGIKKGNNYIWVDRRWPHLFKHWWKAFMVPQEDGAKPSLMKRGGQEFSHGADPMHDDPSEPRLVYTAFHRSSTAFGACLDDPNCGSGHCGYGDVDAY